MRLDMLELSGNIVLIDCGDQRRQYLQERFKRIQNLSGILRLLSQYGIRPGALHRGGWFIFYSFVTTGITMGLRWVFLKR